MSTIEQLNTQLTHLKNMTTHLQTLLSTNTTEASAFVISLENIQTTTAAINAIGPIANQRKIPGLYETWSELVLALVSAKNQGLGESEATLDQTIDTVRLLRRKFNLAPGGA